LEYGEVELLLKHSRPPRDPILCQPPSSIGTGAQLADEMYMKTIHGAVGAAGQTKAPQIIDVQDHVQLAGKQKTMIRHTTITTWLLQVTIISVTAIIITQLICGVQFVIEQCIVCKLIAYLTHHTDVSVQQSESRAVEMSYTASAVIMHAGSSDQPGTEQTPLFSGVHVDHDPLGYLNRPFSDKIVIEKNQTDFKCAFY